MNSLIRKSKALFLDSIKFRVCGGAGGHGLPQYGGIGGRGGDVYIQGSNSVKSLKSILLKSGGHFKAGNGFESRRTRLVGESGKDLVIRVPIGVTIEDGDKQFLGDINSPDEKVIVALGGRGGDKFNDNQGFEGQRRLIKLDLKLISDAVLVGFPNAGKSSLLKAISSANPKVADYPFTTLKPNLGSIIYNDFRNIKVADLPGLVEGAHKNLGLGHEFLKHIIRSKLLIFVIDVNDIDLGPQYPHRSPFETLCILNREIELYDDTILNKPSIIVMSKSDTREDSAGRFDKFKEELETLRKDPNCLRNFDDNLKPNNIIVYDELLPISSATRHNIDRLKGLIREVIDKYAEMQKVNDDKFSSYRDLQPLENNRIKQ